MNTLPLQYKSNVLCFCVVCVCDAAHLLSAANKAVSDKEMPLTGQVNVAPLSVLPV